MAQVTAKVRCHSKTISGTGENRQVLVKFAADYNDGRNKEWSLYTPSLDFSMSLKGDVADRFELEGSYLVTFDDDTPPATEPADLDA